MRSNSTIDKNTEAIRILKTAIRAAKRVKLITPEFRDLITKITFQINKFEEHNGQLVLDEVLSEAIGDRVTRTINTNCDYCGSEMIASKRNPNLLICHGCNDHRQLHPQKS